MDTIQPGAPDPAQRIRILLVEDNEAAGRGLARLLEAEGFEVTVRRDGVSAMQTLESDPPPDFILTDLRLPDLDGREIAQRARDLVPRPLVALITGWDLDCDLVNYQSWGIDWVFPKPLDTKSLIALLRETKP